MRIESSSQIGGVRLIDIRRMFRNAGLSGEFSIAFACEQLLVNRSQAARVLRLLQEEGLVEPVSGRWRLAREGIRLRAATAAKPLLRTTADRLLRDLFSRIEALNKSPHFLALVEQAVVFGSYLGSGNRLGDVDVAIQWGRREKDFEAHWRANSKRVADELRKGRHFSNMVEESDWWRREAVLFLRNRRRGLSLHDYASDKEVVDQAPHRVIFPQP